MRELSIISGYLIEEGRTISIQCFGLINPKRIGRTALMVLAGWPSVTDAAVSVDEVSQYESEERPVGPEVLVPREGQACVYVLNKQVFLN